MILYQQYYGLTGLPFQLTPDSHFFFGSAGHNRALSHLVYGLQQQEAFVVITGEVGAGKTTLVEWLRSQLDGAAYMVVRVNTTRVSADDLLRLVASGFGVEDATDKATMLRRIEERLRALRAEGRRPLLVVDEVQGLSISGLEELRMISNISDSGRSLVQMVLLGQPEFRRTLASPELNQLRQRVVASYHLGPLTVEETKAYIEHRLRAVGWTGRPVWEAAAVAEIYRHTGGIPRRVNRLCSRLLLHGALDESGVITAPMVQTIAAELEADIGHEPPAPAAELVPRIDRLEGKLERLLELFASPDRAGAA